jgi:RNA polymerase sigma-70 factor (ECF subfamily)
LVKKAKSGDQRAFEVLVLKYQQRIFALISRYVRDHDEVQDVAQEAFIKAWRALPRFRGDSAFYTWLYRIAVNTAKNHLVSLSRRPPGSDLDAAEAEQYSGAEMLHEIGTPESHLLSDELEAVIHKSIEELPQELRTAVTLREFEGLSYEDIAAVMECPVGTVRSRIFRAREAIDEAVRPLLGSQRGDRG